MQQSFRRASLVLVLGAALGLVSAFSAQAQNIKIAVVGPTTGPVTQYGDMIKEGVHTAVEGINAAGGVNGRLLELVNIDDGCEPKQGPVAANRVVNNKIRFVVGPVCSGAAIAAADIYNEEGIVMVTPSVTSPMLTEGKRYEFIFRTIGRDDQQGPAAAAFILDKIKTKKVAVVHDKQSYGQGIATAVKNKLEQGGVEVVLFEGINARDSDYSALITKLKSHRIDFVYYGGYHPEMGLLLRQAAEQGVKAKFMGPDGVGNPSINAIAGDAVKGMLLTLPADFSKNPANAEIVQAFQRKSRNPAGAFQLSAYAATQAIVEGIKATDSTDPAKIAQYLHANSVDTPLGKVSWNKQGDLNDFKFAVFSWNTDGSTTAQN
jgi:branched-chain amino acid transport system substrate-binding protein